MKKMTFFACAAVLTSAVVLTGCKDDKNAAKAPQVTTDITLSLPAQLSNGMLRMPGRTVQTGAGEGGVYADFAVNGMTNVTLIPFAKSAAVTTESKRLGENINLAGSTSSDILDGNTNPDGSNKGRTKLYKDAKVPAGTSAFLFYGKSNAQNANLFNIGSLTESLTGEPATYKFELRPIVITKGNVTSDAAFTGLLDYLNCIANVKDSAAGKAWKEYTAGDNEGYYELFQSYKTLNVLSSEGVERMMTDFYQTLKPIAASDSLATHLKDSLVNGTYATLGSGDSVKLVAALQNFPQKFSLPVGAVAIAYSAGAFTANSNSAAPYGANLSPTELDRYVYPSSLWYFANTKIKTSLSQQEANYTSGTAWSTILSKYEKDNSSVNSKTRSIALKDTIQYAVARLDVMVKNGGSSYLEDNDSVAAMKNVANPGAGYPVTAVLIGGQKNVGFDFTPTTYAGSHTDEYTIYDSIMTDNGIAAVPGSYSVANSTLVLETAAEYDVYIAVEFVNKSAKDFYGHDGIVPRGSKFYMVGKLTGANATETDKKVFKQDYTTTARLTMTSLKNAYTVIPDLKSPQLEIGMLVDLQWKSGHTFDVDFE